MNTIKQFVILFLFLISFNGFTQNYTSQEVKKGEIRKYYRKIFKLPIDSIIDYSNEYKLLYVSSKGWIENGSTQYKRIKNSGTYKISEFSKIALSKLINKPNLSQEIDTIQSSSQSSQNLETVTNSFFIDHIIISKKDVLYTDLKRKKHDPNSKVAISLGDKYLLILSKFEYIGHNSHSSTSYSYYEKVE